MTTAGAPIRAHIRQTSGAGFGSTAGKVSFPELT
jgi:hypothetical protein